jgi:hypothetical protein
MATTYQLPPVLWDIFNAKYHKTDSSNFFYPDLRYGPRTRKVTLRLRCAFEVTICNTLGIVKRKKLLLLSAWTEYTRPNGLGRRERQ